MDVHGQDDGYTNRKKKPTNSEAVCQQRTISASMLKNTKTSGIYTF